MKRILLFINICIITFSMCYDLQAQSLDAMYVQVSGEVVDEFGEPIKDVIVRSSVKKAGQLTSSKGEFTINVLSNDYITLYKQGAPKQIVKIVGGELQESTIVLSMSDAVAADHKHSVSKGSLPFDRITGSVERITGEELADFPSFYSMEALAGRLSGVQVGFGQTSMGSESFDVTSRGEAISAYVDGLPTNTITNTASEIDEIIIGKDFGSVSQFGPTATAGAMYINSRRGAPGDLQVNLSADYGVRTPTLLPEMMNSYQYAQTINKGAVNDGKAEVYSQKALDAYKNNTNPLFYPNHDYYEELVSNPATYTNVSANLSGGDKAIQYYSYLGYYGTTGLESVGYGRKSTNLRLNNNVVIKLGDDGKVDLGIGGSYDKASAPAMSSDSLFTTMYSYPANAMPWMVNDSTFVRTPEYGVNMLADLGYQAKTNTEIRNSYSRLGFDYDLGRVVPGLQFAALVGLTVDNTITQSLNSTVDFGTPILLNNYLGEEYLKVSRYAAGSSDNSWSKSYDQVRRSQYANIGLSYDQGFDNDKHQINAVMSYTYSNDEVSTTIQYNRDLYYGLRANYMYNHKYVLEGNIVAANSRILDASTRTRAFFTGGLGWLLHKEQFIKDASWIDYLKLRANVGEMGVSCFKLDPENPTSYFLYDTMYGKGENSGNFGVVANTSLSTGRYNTTTAAEAGSLDWATRFNVNVGLDFVLFDGHVQGQVNYFENHYSNQFAIPTNIYALIGSYSSNLPYQNLVNTSKSGVDFRVAYKNRVGEFSYMVDLNAMYAAPFTKQGNAFNYDSELSYLNTNNNYSDVIYGLDADGLYTSADQITNGAARPALGTVREGDIKYLDYNNDKVIDENDYHEIGHASRFNFGLNFAFKYKGFGLMINTDGKLGGERINSLMWNRGTQDYLADAVNSYPASEKYPRLTLSEGANNYRNSTFWLVSASYFNLRAVALTYELPAKWMTKSALKGVKLHVAGKNLATASADALTYPLLLSSGYTVSPVLRTVELGVDINF